MGKIKVKIPLPVKIFCGVILLILAYFVFIGIHRKVTVQNEIQDVNQFYAMVYENVLNYRSDITFDTNLSPDYLDYDRIFYDLIEKDTYIGSQIYSYRYYYTYKNGKYHVNLKINHPIPHRTVLTKMRAKEIAKRINSLGLSDYDKIKLVHDYLIILNEYSYSESGAYNGFYTKVTACNGYSYCFYDIMTELGIPVTCEFGGNHEWNRVMLDGKWYNMDLTWDDLGGTNVSYDYFLKCDRDWKGHVHGGATANQSIEPVGNSAIDNYHLIPNYMVITAVVILIILAACMGLLYLSVKFKDKRPVKPVEKLTVYSIDDIDIK